MVFLEWWAVEMGNLKLRVVNEAESREAQGLFFELGYGFEGCKNKDVQFFEYVYPFYFFAYKDKDLTVSGDNSVFSLKTDHKEITLPQLRDLVVLKRNDVGDATHTCNGCKYYLTPSEFFEYINDHWENVDEHVGGCAFEPIEKKMKEYLEPHPNGKYVFIKAEKTLHPSWIEIPKGADIAVKYKNGAIEFFKENYSMFWLVKFSKWVETMNAPKLYKHGDIFWQRENLNDKVASAEEYRQSETEYLMQGKNGDKLMESLAQFNNTDRGADFDNFELLEDSVNHPSHYTGHPSGIECIEITRHHDFAIGNAIKYLWRAGLKNSDNEVQDLEKAVWYIQDKIKQLKKLNENSGKD